MIFIHVADDLEVNCYVIWLCEVQRENELPGRQLPQFSSSAFTSMILAAMNIFSLSVNFFVLAPPLPKTSHDVAAV